MKTTSKFPGYAAAALACACANANAVSGVDGPWSILVGGTVPSQTTDGYYMPILVSSLDGTTPVGFSTKTSPGKKQLLLDTPRAANDRAPSHKRMELDMAPCVRYFVAGKKFAPASLRWVPEVYRTEAIGECVAEFKVEVKLPATIHAVEKIPGK